jgi:hypothetical protein
MPQVADILITYAYQRVLCENTDFYDGLSRQTPNMFGAYFVQYKHFSACDG